MNLPGSAVFISFSFVGTACLLLVTPVFLRETPCELRETQCENPVTAADTECKPVFRRENG